MFPYSRFWLIIAVTAILVCYLSKIEHQSPDVDHESFDDLRSEASYVPNFTVTLQRRCASSEKDMGTYCEKKGCPDGMERGREAGKMMCYPKCASGYESNGMSRCYQNCPSGYQTRLTQCLKPRHEFAKDIVPCKDCNITPEVANVLIEEQVKDPTIGIITAHPQLVRSALLDVNTGSVLMSQPTTVHSFNVPMDPAMMYRASQAATQQGVVNNQNPGGYSTGVNRLEEKFQSDVQTMNGQNNNQYTDTGINVGNFNGTAVPGSVNRTMIPSGNQGRSGVYNMDPSGNLNCPLGYAQSGDLCYENCPSNYRDEGDKCIRDQYIIDRPSYDRGSGAPYVTRRPKFQMSNYSY